MRLSPFLVKGRRKRELRLPKTVPNSTILSGGAGMIFVGKNNTALMLLEISGNLRNSQDIHNFDDKLMPMR